MKISSIQQVLGWMFTGFLGFIGITMVCYGERRGLTYLLLAIALFPQFDLPIAVRALLAVVGVVLP